MDNPGITDEAKEILDNHPWPGNVRELGNCIQKTLIFNRGAPISPEDINQAISGQGNVEGGGAFAGDEGVQQWIVNALTAGGSDNLFESCMDRFARMLISEALRVTGGNRSRAAKLLGLSRPTLHSKIEKYHLKFETSVKETS
ncbi:Putative Nitrogen assimilation regulatory protein (fragment) [uncultured Desulfatiglans sp.]